MAWWAWVLLAWPVIAALAAWWIGAAARRIKQLERLDRARAAQRDEALRRERPGHRGACRQLPRTRARARTTEASSTSAVTASPPSSR
jgi:hypothetical protein